MSLCKMCNTFFAFFYCKKHDMLVFFFYTSSSFTSPLRLVAVVFCYRQGKVLSVTGDLRRGFPGHSVSSRPVGYVVTSHTKYPWLWWLKEPCSCIQPPPPPYPLPLLFACHDFSRPCASLVGGQLAFFAIFSLFAIISRACMLVGSHISFQQVNRVKSYYFLYK